MPVSAPQREFSRWGHRMTGSRSRTSSRSPAIPVSTSSAELGIGHGLCLLLLIAALANALNQADRAIMPIAVIPMSDEFGWTLMDKGIVLSSFALGYLFSQVPSGLLAMQLPPFCVLTACVLVWSVTTLLTPLAASFGLRILLACRFCMGVAEGFALPAIFQLFSTSVPSHLRSRSFALTIGCGSLGQLLAMVVCPRMSPWSAMFTRFGLAGMLWCSVVLLLWLASPRDLHFIWQLKQGSKLRMDTLVDTEQRPEANLFPRGGDQHHQQLSITVTVAAMYDVEMWKHMLACRPLYAICAAHFGQNWLQYTLSIWLPTYLHDVLGMPSETLWLIAIPYLANAVTGFVAGCFADMAVVHNTCTLSTARRIATAVGLLGPAACALLLTLAKSPHIAVGIVTCSAVFGAVTSSGYMANHADISSRYAGLTFGISNTLATVPGLMVGPLTAWLVRANGGLWAPIFVLAAVINVVCTCIYLTYAQAHNVL
mmetsp:Transcript_139108/g.245790  ORF Transcript_139108/g.245790 Transcript_139108/m.245790 type:complete len:484 (-) Transcript_139108:106-1557(-)